MTNERFDERDRQADVPRPDRAHSHAERDAADRDAADRDDKDTDVSPWLKEGADAPDAADIAEPGEQR
jgi:hypothetical protein